MLEQAFDTERTSPPWSTGASCKRKAVHKQHSFQCKQSLQQHVISICYSPDIHCCSKNVFMTHTHTHFTNVSETSIYCVRSSVELEPLSLLHRKPYFNVTRPGSPWEWLCTRPGVESIRKKAASYSTALDVSSTRLRKAVCLSMHFNTSSIETLHCSRGV
eukprot:1187523-Amphidinium_carterae.2